MSFSRRRALGKAARPPAQAGTHFDLAGQPALALGPRSIDYFSGCTNCGVCLTACSKQGGSLAWGFRR